MATRARTLLLARSRIARDAEGDDARLVATEPRLPPQAGHRAARASASPAVSRTTVHSSKRDCGPHFTICSIPPAATRPAPRWFLDAAMRWHPARQRVRLDSLTLVGLVSEPVWDDLLRPIAWHVDVGATSRWLHDDGRPARRCASGWWRARAAGVGLARAWAPRFAGRLDRRRGRSESASPPCLRTRSGSKRRRAPARRCRSLLAVHGYARLNAALLGDDTLAWRAGIEQRLALGANRALRARRGPRRRLRTQREWVGRLGLDVFTF